MIDERLAVPYDGGTKMPPCDWLSFYEDGEMECEEWFLILKFIFFV